MKTILIICGIVLGIILMLMLPAYCVQKLFPENHIEIAFAMIFLGIFSVGIGAMTFIPLTK